MAYQRLGAPISQLVTNGASIAVDVVAFPAGRQPLVLGRLAPGQAQSFTVVAGDSIRAFNPATRAELASFIAGKGPMTIPGGHGAPAMFAPQPASPAPSYGGGGGGSATIVTMPLDDADPSSIGKIRSRLKLISGHAINMNDVVESGNRDMQGRMRVNLRPNQTQKNGAAPLATEPDRQRFNQIRDALIPMLKTVRDAAKEISVHMVMGNLTAEEQRMLAVDLTLVLDKLKEAFQAIESFRVIEVYPPLPSAGCCSSTPPPDPVVMHALVNDRMIASYLAEIKKNLDTDGLNLSNMKIKMSADLGGSFTVGGNSQLGFDNAAREKTVRATAAASAAAGADVPPAYVPPNYGVAPPAPTTYE